MNKPVMLSVFANISLFAQDLTTVSGAGNTYVNGDYNNVGTYNSKAYYSLPSTNVYIIWSLTRANVWQIYDALGSMENYYNTQDTGLPPADGWGVSAAPPPVPTLSGGVMLVELISFAVSVDGESIVLNWNTATEVNNYGFEVQKSVVSSQNSEFETVGFVNGHGNSNSPKKYSFTNESITARTYKYRLKQIDNDGTFEYSDIVEVSFIIPEKFALEQNFPNPFNPATKIKYTIPAVGTSFMKFITLKVYDVLGNEVATFVEESKPAGTYEIEFNAANLASGVYFYRLSAGDFTETKKMLVIK